MKKLFIVLSLLFATQMFAQQFEEVVHLKNGSIVRGTIIEQTPNVSIKIQTRDKNVFVYRMDEVLKITKEEISSNSSQYPIANDKLMQFQAEKKSPGLAAGLSLVLTSAGHAYAGNWGRGLLFTGGRVASIILAVTLGISEERYDYGWGVYGTTLEINSFYYIGLLGSVAIGIWEAVDAYGITSDSNAELYQRITGKKNES